MNIGLSLYNNEREDAIALIQNFWLNHNHYRETDEEAMEDLSFWTGQGHRFYFIITDCKKVGFVHLGSRGAEPDWLEDIFVMPAYQNKGIGSMAIELTEGIVREYSASLYIEVAAWNKRALQLYRKLGYDCLNTITIRKDFCADDLECVSEESILDLKFEIKKRR